MDAQQREQLFNRESEWLDRLLRERSEQLAAETGLPLRAAVCELGRAALVMGVTYTGNAVELPAWAALAIARDALQHIEAAARRQQRSRN